MRPPPGCDDPLVRNTDAVDDMPQESDGFDIIGAINLWDTTVPAESSRDPSSFYLEKNGIAGSTDQQPATEYEVGFLGGGGDQCPSEDLAMVFLDWLKSNKDSISAEDLRSIKLKRWTIECAARRLGGGKQGRVQLLKLILSWIQNHHLKKRRRRSRGVAARDRTTNQDFSATAVAAPATQFSYPPPLNTNLPLQQEAPPNPNIDFNYDAAPYKSWMPYAAEPSFPQMVPGNRGKAAAPYHYYHDQTFSPLAAPDQFEAADHVAAAWPQGFSSASSSVHYSPFGPTPASPRLQHFAAAQYHAWFAAHFAGAQQVYCRMASVTKEARKKRMARKKRLSFLHHHRSQQNRQPQQ